MISIEGPTNQAKVGLRAWFLLIWKNKNLLLDEVEQIHICYLGISGRAAGVGGPGLSDPQITRHLERLPGSALLHLPLVGKRQISPGPSGPEFTMQSLQERLLGEPCCSLSQQV